MTHRIFVAVVVALFVGCVHAGAQAPRQQGNPTIAHRLFTAIDAGDLRRAADLLHDSLQLHYNGVPDPLPKATVLDLIKGYYTAFPDNKHDILQALVSDGHTVVRLMQQATHRGAYEGVLATGKRVSVGAIHIFRVQNGKVIEWWAAEDDLGLLRQIGMIIKPPSP